MNASLSQMPRRVSLVAQTVAALKGEILRGRWQGWLPGEHDLCSQLNVSRVTLRAALKELDRDKWVQTSQGRRRQIVDRPLAPEEAGRARPIVLLSPEPLPALPTFAVFWIDCLRKQLSDSDLHLDVQVSRNCYGPRSKKTLEALRERVGLAMWVLYRSTYEVQQWFADRQIPCVITGTRHPGIELPSLDTDYRATCRHAAGRFIARGHRHLALLNPATGTGGELESEQGFREAVENSGVNGVTFSLVRHDGTVPVICARLDALLRQVPRPTALLVSRPVHVLTAMGHLLRRGLRIPADIALISRDDDPFLAHVVPGIARYTSNPMLFAQKLSRLVLEGSYGNTLRPVDVKLMPRFVAAESFR